MTEQIAVAGTVSGRVQGVAYRASMQREAQKLGLQGWVKNLPDGRVAFHAQGDEAVVASLLRWAERGPIAARVVSVDYTESTAGAFSDFSIRY